MLESKSHALELDTVQQIKTSQTTQDTMSQQKS